jgi:hypothetical protein
VTGIPGAGGDPIPAAPKRADGEVRSAATGAFQYLGGVKYRIQDGIVYDAKKLLADVRETAAGQGRQRIRHHAAGARRTGQEVNVAMSRWLRAPRS